jgi:hypothetical protein
VVTPTAVAPAPTLAATLAATLGKGQPVAILPRKDGLVAVSADGKRSQVLVADKAGVKWALVDQRARVVWFEGAGGSAIRVLDLEGPDGATPVAVVTGLPRKAEQFAPAFALRYAAGPVEGLALLHEIRPAVTLVLGAKPALEAEPGILEMWEQDRAFRRAVKKAKIVEPALLTRLAARGAGRSLVGSPGAELPEKARLAVEGPCEEEELCGTGQEVRGTGLWRVIVGHGCGDGCYVTYQLYDPATKKLLGEPWARALQKAWVAPEARAFIVDGAIIHLQRGPLTPYDPEAESPRLGGGWLGAQTFYD